MHEKSAKPSKLK